MLETVWDILKDAYDRFYKDDGFPNSGNIAYCIILALFPFLIFLFSATSFFGDAALAEGVIGALLQVAPAELVNPLRGEITSLLTGQRRDLLTISGLFTIWTSSRGVESLRTGLNRAYRFTETRAWWVRALHDIVIVICGAVIAIALALTIVFAPTLWSLAVARVPQLGSAQVTFDFLRYVVGFCLLLIGLVGGHVFLPARRLPLSVLWPGIMITLVFWFIIAVAYSYYLSQFAYFTTLYAGLGGLFAALIFLYFSAAIFQFGGEINRAMYAHRNLGFELPRDAGKIQ